MTLVEIVYAQTSVNNLCCVQLENYLTKAVEVALAPIKAVAPVERAVWDVVLAVNTTFQRSLQQRMVSTGLSACKMERKFHGGPLMF